MRLSIPFTLCSKASRSSIRSSPRARDLAVRVSLVHEDRDLDIPLYHASDDRDVTAVWQFWANRLGLPLLVVDGRTARSASPFRGSAP